MKNFRTLNLALEFYRNAKNEKFPKRFLQDQYDRALLSIVLNLSEGNAKPSAKDRRRFFYIALGSMREVQTLLLVSDKEVLFQDADAVAASLYRLCKSL
ncbi:MAG: four helix bundle protein [Halobacteriovoraceae bacterium]|nr:four helix bundle protein [Halobacteriovoraceae bacterium]